MYIHIVRVFMPTTGFTTKVTHTHIRARLVLLASASVTHTHIRARLVLLASASVTHTHT